MTILRPELVSGDTIAMQVNNPRHLVKPDHSSAGKTGEAVFRSDSFGDMMLQRLDQISVEQLEPERIARLAITAPGTVDAHDVTIAQAKASMSLDITRTILNRVVQGWRDLINTR
jgi:flagellar hook-basal body complex protein FliE